MTPVVLNLVFGGMESLSPEDIEWLLGRVGDRMDVVEAIRATVWGLRESREPSVSSDSVSTGLLGNAGATSSGVSGTEDGASPGAGGSVGRNSVSAPLRRSARMRASATSGAETRASGSADNLTNGDSRSGERGVEARKKRQGEFLCDEVGSFYQRRVAKMT